MDIRDDLMNWSRLRSNGSENVFKGSQLVTIILERHHQHFRSRATALKFCRQLFNDGVIRGVFGATSFEDSVQLYTWADENGGMKMTSRSASKLSSGTQNPAVEKMATPPKSYGYSSADVTLTKRELYKQREAIKPIERSRESSSSMQYSHDVNRYFREIQNDVNDRSEQHVTSHPHISSYQTSWNLQRASTASSESSVDILSHSYSKHSHRDKSPAKTSFSSPATSNSRDHDVIPEEADHEVPLPVMERTTTSSGYDGTSSFPRSVTTTDTSTTSDVDGMTSRITSTLVTSQQGWQQQPPQDYQNSYSDNEKQLIEQMKRMKKEHSHILRTYEDRINKLMTKMHELRSIAEMLENSSTKSSPYAMMNNKNGVLNFLNSKSENDRKLTPGATGIDGENPPPLPPRPGRGSRLNPSKPFIHTDANMTSLPWTRIILKDESGEEQTTIWHHMMEPKVDPEEVERLFSLPSASQTDGATLYDDLIIRRGRSRQQLVSIYDSERSKRIVVCMKCLRATLNDVISSVSTLDTSQINHEGLAELSELLSPNHDVDKILYHVRKKGAGHLDHPEYLVFELSKVDHFKDRLEFIRFRFRLLWHLFEIDQQMRELNTACDEVSTSTPLKNLLETLLSVGNYMNGATEMGQADGFNLDVINKLKDLRDRDGKGTLLEFVLKTYCQVFESEVEIGCPTRFRLPEPSNMRHAALVSFEGLQDALSNLHSDLRHVRERLLDPRVNKDTTRPMDSFRVTAENFFAAALEVIGEQEKVLQDTRDIFDKTINYFYVDKQRVTPQQFFHVWAVFLHDCKYFWKLAHRRLAKERFELEFKYKGQLSASSLQGYGTFRAGVLQGLDSNNVNDPKTSTAQRNNARWAEAADKSTRPTVPPKPSRSRNADDVYHPSSDRSSSPKPLTSMPPSSVDVRKPQPKPHAQNGTPPFSPIPPPNYENHSELERFQGYKYPQQHHQQQQQLNSFTTSGQPPPSGHVTPPAENGITGIHHDSSSAVTITKESDKKSQQFSLKAWLKREREQVRKGVECDAADGIPEAKTQSPAKSFSKFKNNMKQKFSSGSSKKHNDHSRKSKDTKSGDPKAYESPVAAQNGICISSPYDGHRPNYPTASTSGFKLGDKFQVPDNGLLASLESEFNSRPIPDTIISPIDDPDADDILASVNRYEHQNGVPPQMRQNVEQNDVNNNERYLFNSKSGGSNANDNGNGFPDGKFVSPGAESKRVVAVAAPSYKARMINNYENQGKFENPNIPRLHAEPAKSLRQNFANLTSNISNDIAKGYDGAESKNPYSKNGHDQTQPQTSSNHTHNTRPLNAEDSPYGRLSKTLNTPEKHAALPDTPRKRAVLENKNYVTPGNRVPINAQSVGSLIDKFDKTESYNEESATNRDGLPEASPPLPPRSGKSQSHIQNVDAPSFSQSSLAAKPYSAQPSTAYSPPSRWTTDKRGETYPSTPNRREDVSTAYNSPHSLYSTPQGQFSEGQTHSTYVTPKSSPANHKYTPLSNGHVVSTSSPSNHHVTNGFHENNGYLDNDRADNVVDDGYGAKLRRAANYSHSAFDRITKGSSPYTRNPSFGTTYEARRNIFATSTSSSSAVQNTDEVSYMAI
ncbi:uncharacterized protein LOC127844592 isoform X1 [Dreissena polymorpha]|uniref:uncharacterized protein LOC127844592 isoform X1 n=2 Tax=Dreissena polymorpha TaxID=45954 RepID=UPI0022644C97|nr:uncharacterized protein LOC127844592 isoform X1 [Dreissena polymorpha]XP_052230925.1 uncharacterized protein LOC127844592 isoform X1 [Dreissena polymorpha]XP_052230926.1 uncharacterized protein LOC127844592 isoform X1 [Dreissena polymorpha]